MHYSVSDEGVVERMGFDHFKNPWHVSEQGQKKVYTMLASQEDQREHIKRAISSANITLQDWGEELTVNAVHRDSNRSSQYLADTRAKEPSNMERIPLTDYISDLKEFSIIQDVYVLSDDREDDGTVNVLIKLKPLMQLSPMSFESQNSRITNYLQCMGVENSKEVHVSFQYTEVFK